MRDFFSRTPTAGDDEPVDLARLQADDALIEALRAAPLFEQPTEAPVTWLRSVHDPDRHDPDRRGDDLVRDPAASTDREPSASDLSSDDLGADYVSADDLSVDDLSADDEYAAFTRFARADAAVGAPAPRADDARIAALLQAWRSELDAVPLPPPLDLQVATAIVRSAPRRRRSVRPMIAVAAAIAGLLLGSTAIGARSATPDNTLLWPVTQLLWGDQAEQVMASIDARQGIDGAAKALDAGHPEQAEAALDHVTSVITKVEDSSERQTLQSDLGRVRSQLEASRTSTSASTSAGTTSPTAGSGSSAPVNPASPTASPSSAPSAPSTSSDEPGTSTTPTSDPVLPPVSTDVTTSESVTPSSTTSDTGTSESSSTTETSTGTETSASASSESSDAGAPEGEPAAENGAPDEVPAAELPAADQVPAN